MRSSKRPSKADLASHVPPAETNERDDEPGEQPEEEDVEEVDPLRPAATNISEEDAAHILGDDLGEENPYLATGTLKSAIHRCELPLLGIDQDSTRPNYVSGFMHFKAWACLTLAAGKCKGVPVEEQVVNEDEVGREIGNDLGTGRCVDPHRGSLDDVYSEEQFRILVSDILPHWAKVYFESSMSYPSLSLWKALAVRVMILMAHHMLGRGISIRTIRYCNMFTHTLLPITNSKGESSILVLVVAYRNSKTVKDNKLGHLYLTQHMDFQQCGFGAVFLWLHFIFDLVPLFYNNDKIVPPLDFSNPEAWSKKHLFFALFDKEKTEMPYPTHNKWVTWAMKSAEWILSKVTHIFRRSAAQILADKNLDLDTIAQLGQWDMNEMRRSYVTGIPRPAIQMQAGFSQEPGDYYIGRSKTKVPPKVLKAIEEHIFPKAEMWLIEHLITQLRAEINLHKEEGGNKEIQINHLEKRVETLEREKSSMKAELEAKTEAFAQLQKAFDALKNTAAISAAAIVGESESVPLTATEEATPGPQQAQQTTPSRQSVGSQLDQAFFDAVVWPWCNCETVRKAWSYWDGPSPLNNGHSLRQAYKRGFAVKFCKFTPSPPPVTPEQEAQPKEKPPTAKAIETKLRKMEAVMKAVEHFRIDDSRAATSTVIEKLDSILKDHSINMLSEGIVLKEDSGRQLTKKRKLESAEENRKDKQRLRITLELIRVQLRTAEWAENVFGKEKWNEFTGTTGALPTSTDNRDAGAS
ncbi:unnamed protein product [Closterium sp. Naga37s-1]|nr:unnamed protein product [Closterium sp. Naga37s-1]